MLSFDTLSVRLPPPPATIFIAYSGGLDSHALLHLLATQRQLCQQLRAIYIHHGLQSLADKWAEHCANTAAELHIPFQCIKVDAGTRPGQSPEEAARVARYAALQPLLACGDVLLVAQHQEDQLETVLLQLFRGCGVRGLSAMSADTAFGAGRMLRPLLAVSRQQIRSYAELHQLEWVEDPSNQECDFDRNLLRHKVIPMIKQRWPAVAKAVSRTARHCRAADELLNHTADTWLAGRIDDCDGSLLLHDFAEFSVTQGNLLLRRWLQRCGATFPSEAVLSRIVDEVIYARRDAMPEVELRQHWVKKFNDKLYCIDKAILSTEPLTAWPVGLSSIVLANGYQVKITQATHGIPQDVWHNCRVTIRTRQGGELVSLPKRKGRHALKKLFQEAKVPPWIRNMMPLIYCDDNLAAVGNLWITAEFYCCEPATNCYQISWERCNKPVIV